VWAPDGTRVIFNSIDGGSAGLAIARIDGGGEYERVAIPGDGVKVACDWSPDGQFILYKQVDETSGTTDLWARRMSGDRQSIPVANQPSNERDGQFSPDGRWMAYESDETGRAEIYVQPFPGPGRKQRVSIDGGTQVRWRRDGKELFYIGLDESLTAVTVALRAGEVEVGVPVPLFKTSIVPFRSISRQQYVVSPDGQRFLIATTTEVSLSPITLILNWQANRNGVPTVSPQ
jgi:dipeptidyl aminopeptidase/acylaminoacyl peptidase